MEHPVDTNDAVETTQSEALSTQEPVCDRPMAGRRDATDL